VSAVHAAKRGNAREKRRAGVGTEKCEARRRFEALASADSEAMRRNRRVGVGRRRGKAHSTEKGSALPLLEAPASADRREVWYMHGARGAAARTKRARRYRLRRDWTAAARAANYAADEGATYGNDWLRRRTNLQAQRGEVQEAVSPLYLRGQRRRGVVGDTMATKGGATDECRGAEATRTLRARRRDER
jgi:hypothetical protein